MMVRFWWGYFYGGVIGCLGSSIPGTLGAKRGRLVGGRCFESSAVGGG